jgi:ribosomal protein S12 methylthiotransferase accessory factor
VEHRCRSLADTLGLAVHAGRAAGVTRVSDVTAFGVSGIPVFQATRPASRSLSVSQGKGLTRTAAIVGALLEATELWSAECLPRPAVTRPLAELGGDRVGLWSGSDRDALAIDLDPATPRGWVRGTDLSTGRPAPMPWDLLSLDFTHDNLEYVATSNGLACGNTREEALVSGIAELLEHHFVAAFDRLSARQRRATQVALATIDDPAIARLLGLVERAGFAVRAWSLAGEHAVPVFEVAMFEHGGSLDEMSPVAGNGCHPQARVAFARALLEAVQTRAGLVAGGRDDLLPGDYGSMRERNAAVLLGSLAFDDGPLEWRSIPSTSCASSGECLDRLIAQVGELTPLPIVAFDHPPPCVGLRVVHVLAPGLLDAHRGPRQAPRRRPEQPVSAPALSTRAGQGAKYVLFAGPSIAGLAVPDGIEIRPPAKCGDLASLLQNPPAAVALADGYFKLAPTVWHKEILGLMALGVRVIGGASLGALRAVELERFGMEGIGAIFDAYRSGAVTRDDAVMLVHAPSEFGYAPLSIPLVDAEYTLVRCGVPGPALRTMQRVVRTTPYETRNWRSCLQRYRERTGEDFPVPLAELEAAPSLKRLDAALLVAALAQHRPQPRIACAMPPLTCHYRAHLARSAPAFAATLP